MSDVDAGEGSVRGVLARWFPQQAIAIAHRAGTGASTPVFRVKIGNDTFWVRTGEQPGERRDGEIVAHRRLIAEGIPAPAVIRYEAMPPELDRSIGLTSHIPGIPLAELSPGEWTAALARDVGRVLARINRVPVRGFGWAYADSKDGTPVGAHTARSAWTREYRDAALLIRKRDIFDASTASNLVDLVDRWVDAPGRGAGSLAHGDFDATHIYVDPDHHTLTGIIDFGELRGADPIYDLGHLLLHDGESGRPELFPHVLDGYAGITPLPDDTMSPIRMQALATGACALAIQLQRPPSFYRDWLVARLQTLLRQQELG